MINPLYVLTKSSKISILRNSDLYVSLKKNKFEDSIDRYQTARLGETYCMCGRSIPLELHCVLNIT